MYVVKRDGRKVPLHLDKITARLKKLSYGISSINLCVVSQKVYAGVSNGVTTMQLDQLAAVTAAAMTVIHHDYASLAGRIAVSNLHKNTKKSFSETIKGMYNHFSKGSGQKAAHVADDVYEIVMKISYVDGDEVTLNLRTQRWEILQKDFARDDKEKQNAANGDKKNTEVVFIDE